MTKTDGKHPFRVLQLTDPHLVADPDGALLGMKTRDSLEAVIAQVLKDRGQPDLILATGDLSQDGSEEAYRVLRSKLAVFACSSAWLAGNHDDVAVLAKCIGHAPESRKQVLAGGWQFILLDSSVPGQVFGRLSEAELGFLEQSLSAHPELPALVTLHHHPVDIGSEWMAPIGLQNRAEFWQVIDRFPQVKIVLWGHIHQYLDQWRGSVRLLATPSTCIQFATGSRGFSVERKAPGYRWLELYPNGEFITEVGRARDFQFDLDLDSDGY